MDLEWMAWTAPTAGFFVVIALLLAAYTVWGLRSPSLPRKGLLPMVTTRGDRLFVGLMGSAFIHLAWVGLTDASVWIALGVSLLFMVVISRWG
jgi:predicted small integral membrane protein